MSFLTSPGVRASSIFPTAPSWNLPASPHELSANHRVLGGCMKILLVHNHYQQPGGEDVVFAQERLLLRSHGHHVVTYQRSNIEIEGYSLLQKATVPKRAVWSSDSRADI